MLVEPNFEEMPKVAFVGALASRGLGVLKNLGGRFFRQGAGRYLGGRAVATAPYKALAPYADQAEKALIGGIGRIAPSYAPQAQMALKRVGRRALAEAIPGAGIGGVLGGVGGALTAEEGERGKGFLRGAAGGIGMGALSGAVSGAGSQVVGNLKGQAVKNLAKTHGMTGQAVRDQMNNTGVFKSLGQAFGRENTPERALARTKLTAGAGMLGANFVLPELVYPTAPGQPPAPKQPELNPNQPSVYYQNQNQKFGSDSSSLKAIDFSRLPTLK